jgi:hypothetical protein
MILNPKYTFIIKDASDKLYEFNNCTQRAWEWYENDVGRCRFFVPYSDLKLTNSSVPDDRFSEILIYRDGTLVWQGMTQILQDGLDGVWVYGETFMAALAWYGVRYDQVYTTSPISTIISNEYDDIAARSYSVFNSKIIKGTISTDVDILPVTRTFYNEDLLSVLRDTTSIAMSGVTEPTDAVNVVFNISFSEQSPTFSYKNVGSTKGDVILELDSELIDFNNITDMRTITNWVKSYTITSGPDVLTSQKNISPTPLWYTREIYPFFPNINSQADLDRITTMLLRENNVPAITTNIKFIAGLKPFDGYSMGDIIKLRIKRGRIDTTKDIYSSYNDYRRVVGMEVQIDDTGIEYTKPILRKLRRDVEGGS